MQFDLEGKVAIVTGASRGIGAAIATALAEAGAYVVLTARDEVALSRVMVQIKARTGREALVVAADLRTQYACGRIVEEVMAKVGDLHILINNAGATVRGDFLRLSDADYTDGFELKFLAAVRLCRAAWPHLSQSGGSIVNIAGTGGRTPSAEFTVGGPINSAVINFTKAIAERGIVDGVRVNAINPGHVLTGRLAKRIRIRAATDSISLQHAEERMRAELGIKRFGRPEEIAKVAVFLCSDQASYIQGATIDVDGGTTKGI